jgi:hypothetical protein
MTYCAACGSRLGQAARFCADCGSTVELVQPQPATSVPRAPVEQPAGPISGPLAQPRLAARQVSAFSAIPMSDYVRDGLAATALILSLFMVWQYGAGSDEASIGSGIAAARIDVILVSLVSLLSLGITYLWRAGVFGPAWDYAKTQDLRLLANTPYFLMVVVYLIIELVGHQGLGPAVAFGLAGALLAAQPRRAELADGDVPRDRRWLHVVIGLAAVVALLTVIQIIEMFVLFPSQDVGSMLLSIIMGAASAALLLRIASQVARSAGAWRLTGIGVGIAAAGLGLLSLSPQFSLVQVSFFGSSPSMSLMFWMALGAAVSAPSVARLMKPEVSEAAPWLASVSLLLGLAVWANALMSLMSIIGLIQQATSGSGQYTPWILSLFFGGVGTVAGVIVRATASKDEHQGLLLATAYAALLFVLGLVLVILWSIQTPGGISPLTVIIGFVIPTGLAGMLWGPRSVRRHFESLLPPSHTGTAGFAFAGVQQPVVEPVQSARNQVEPESGLEAIRAEASNTATSAARLQTIASTVPEARALVAANSSAYPALLAWLGQQGDPEVNAVLARRSRS